jgi:hypothetical protein
MCGVISQITKNWFNILTRKYIQYHTINYKSCNTVHGKHQLLHVGHVSAIYRVSIKTMGYENNAPFQVLISIWIEALTFSSFVLIDFL